MARYIDADKYVEYLEKEICSKCIDEVCGACGLDSARWIAEEIPAEDVVPRAKAEIMQKALLLDVLDTFRNLLCIESFVDYEDTKKHYVVSLDDVERIHDELKKKYTEEKK